MVLGLIDFLLGGKKKTKVPRNAQVSSPSGSVGGSVSQSTDSGVASSSASSVPDGTSNPTQNVESSKLEFQDSTTDAKPETSTQSNDSNANLGGKKSISEVINRIHKELKSTNESVVNLVTEVKEVQNSLNGIDHRVSELEGGTKQFTEKMSEIDDNMGKFLSLYELVNNQYNPFVDSDSVVKPKEIVLSADGSSMDGSSDDLSQDEIKSKLTNLDTGISSDGSSKSSSEADLDASLLELDTLDIEAAAGDAVPLTRLKSNTNSLVVILSWLEYMVKKTGVDDTKNNLRYYTETLRWITPEVYFELDKFLKGMKDLESSENRSLNVRDHIVSLYFISKLNEKVLDQKLTKAVLQIIKEQ